MDTLSVLVDAALAVEKIRVRSQVRQSHLRLQGRVDSETDALVEKLLESEGYIDSRVAAIIKSHPAYPWFSRVTGIGKENIGKVVGQVDIERANTPSALWSFAGYAVEDGKALRRVKGGGKLSYNSQLRSMCWRLGAAIKKAGIRRQCTKCRALFGGKEKDGTERTKCPKCSGILDIVGTSEFAKYYLVEKDKYIKRFMAQGIKILPTPAGRWCCLNCGQSWERKKDIVVCCSSQTIAKKLREEPPGIIWLGHLDNMSLRKVIKLFLACLWLVWRKAKGLPVTMPYAIDKLGHNSFIDPWEMIDR